MKTNETDFSEAEQTGEYMLLFRGDHWDKNLSPQELKPLMDKVSAWFERLQKEGLVKAGQPLAPVGRLISGTNRAVADGPFTEAKEVVGGYLLLQADSLDAAVAIARACPTVDYGISVEVRPVLVECPCTRRALARLAEAAA
jgi:hypothetical protein